MMSIHPLNLTGPASFLRAASSHCSGPGRLASTFGGQTKCRLRAMGGGMDDVTRRQAVKIAVGGAAATGLVVGADTTALGEPDRADLARTPALIARIEARQSP